MKYELKKSEEDIKEKLKKEDKKKNDDTNNTITHKKRYKTLKILLVIGSLAIIILAIAYIIPVMTKISTPEGKIEFKDKVQSTGFIFWGTVFVLASAAIISTAIFFLVRKLGKKFVYEFCNEDKVKKIENSSMFQNPKKVEMILFILFLLPGTPKDLLVYIAGLLPIKPSRFIIISTLARIPSIVSSTYAGEKILAGNYKTAAFIYIIIILICVILIFVYNKFDKNKTAQEALKTIK